MATSGTNITALAKPAVGVTAGPTWATDLNTSIDAVDNHDHSTNKGVRITPAAVNINADLEFNQNSATELKNVIFDSSVTAATTSYSVYQASGNLYWRNGSGTAVQITTGTTVNAGAGSIDGMTGNDSGVTYVNGAKAFNFFCDSGNTDFGKMAHADLLLYKFSDDNTGDTDYITLAASALASGSSGTVTVPAETGTILTTATSFAGAINVATSSGNANIALKPHGTGFVMAGNGGATGKLTSNGAYDLILSTNSGTNSSTIAITDAANGSISFIPNGTGEIVIGSGAASGKITSSGAHDLVLDTNAGTNAGNITLTDGTNGAITVTPHGSGAFTIGGAWTAASQTCANLGTVTTADINGGTIDGPAINSSTIGASSHTTGKFTTCDATTDFTIGGLVVTDGNIADTGTLAIVPVDGCTIALGSDAGDDFNVDSSKFIVEGDTGQVGVGTADPTAKFEIKSGLEGASDIAFLISDFNNDATTYAMLIKDEASPFDDVFHLRSAGSGTDADLNMYIRGSIEATGSIAAGNLVGMIAPFAMTSPPTGWIVCDGSALARTGTYAALFAALSTTWGVGDGSSTFNVPDLEGAFLRGSGTSTLFTQDSTVTLAAVQDDRFQAHFHTWHGAKQQGGNGVQNNQMTTAQNGTTNQFTDTTLDQKSYTQDTTVSGGTPRPDNETRPNNIGVRYCIKY